MCIWCNITKQKIFFMKGNNNMNKILRTFIVFVIVIVLAFAVGCTPKDENPDDSKTTVTASTETDKPTPTPEITPTPDVTTAPPIPATADIEIYTAKNNTFKIGIPKGWKENEANTETDITIEKTQKEAMNIIIGSKNESFSKYTEELLKQGMEINGAENVDAKKITVAACTAFRIKMVEPENKFFFFFFFITFAGTVEDIEKQCMEAFELIQ